jgi:hypothetical protein
LSKLALNNYAATVLELWLGVNVDDALILQGAVAVVASRAVAVE